MKKYQSKYLKERAEKLCEYFPEMKSIEKRHEALKIVLRKRYNIEHLPLEFFQELLFVDRYMRKLNEGREKKLKKKLEEDYQQQL